jgi:hypothetical protein
MENENPLDVKTAEYLAKWGQSLSRRGLLARLGKLAMWATGISLVPLLPADRIGFAQTGCSDWQLCGIYGNLCKSCCGQGALLFSCPGCTNVGAYWQRCCENTQTCTSRMMRYYDCCGTKPGWTDAQAAACKGAWCERNTLQPAWCGTGQVYRCTYIYDAGPC